VGKKVAVLAKTLKAARLNMESHCEIYAGPR